MTRYSYRRVASDPVLRKLEQQPSAHKGIFVTAHYKNVDIEKFAKFIKERRLNVFLLEIPQNDPILDDFYYPVQMKLLDAFEQRVREEGSEESLAYTSEPEYRFVGPGGRIAGQWSVAQKILSLQFVVQET